MLNAVQKLDNVSVQPDGWDISVIDHAMKIISVKIVSNYAIVTMQLHVMHKTENAHVAQVGLVIHASKNVSPECSDLIVRKNASVILITQLLVMESTAVVFVNPHGEVSLRNISATHSLVILSLLYMLSCKKTFHNEIFIICLLLPEENITVITGNWNVYSSINLCSRNMTSDSHIHSLTAIIVYFCLCSHKAEAWP